MEKIDISDEFIAKARKYVEEGRFKDISDFINQAMKLMIYAEDNKENFVKILKPEDETNLPAAQ